MQSTPGRANASTTLLIVAGNRTSEAVDEGTATTYSYNAANQIDDTGYTYDPNGNLTSDGTDTYTWDRANRLLSVGTHSYKYDGMGDRIQKTVNSTITDYLLDTQPGLTKVIAQTSGGNTDRFIHGVRGIHAMEDSSGVWTYAAQDALGNVRSEIDAVAQVNGMRDLTPFLTSEDEVGTFAMPFVATGEMTDANGQVYLRARYYNPSIGVFNSLDPFEGVHSRPMSLNGYSWVEGNPVMNVDPSGMQSEAEWRTALDMNNASFLNLAFDLPSFTHYVAELYHSNLIPEGVHNHHDFALVLLINKFNQFRCQRDNRDVTQWEYELRLFANGANISGQRYVDDRTLLNDYLSSHAGARSRCSGFVSSAFSCIDETVRSSWTFQHLMRSCLPFRHPVSNNMTSRSCVIDTSSLPPRPGPYQPDFFDHLRDAYEGGCLAPVLSVGLDAFSTLFPSSSPS